jgi:hypothetical protein
LEWGESVLMFSGLLLATTGILQITGYGNRCVIPQPVFARLCSIYPEPVEWTRGISGWGIIPPPWDCFSSARNYGCKVSFTPPTHIVIPDSIWNPERTYYSVSYWIVRSSRIKTGQVPDDDTGSVSFLTCASVILS